MVGLGFSSNLVGFWTDLGRILFDFVGFSLGFLRELVLGWWLGGIGKSMDFNGKS